MLWGHHRSAESRIWTSGSKWTIFSGKVPVVQSQALLTVHNRQAPRFAGAL
jgi:hypothetical protein